MMREFGFLFLITFAVMQPAMAATITGKVVFEGTAPTPQQIEMNADPSCAGAHSEPVFTEDVLVGEGGALKNVFVYVKEGLEGQTFETPTEPVVLDQKGCRYQPRVFGVQINQKVKILNSDRTLHNVHGMPKNSKEFNLGMPIPGMKLFRKFKNPEVMVKFKCDVHPWMAAYGGVVSHPFYSVSDDAGTFELKDLPPGDYVIEAWHEKFGTQSQGITVGEDAQTIDFKFVG